MNTNRLRIERAPVIWLAWVLYAITLLIGVAQMGLMAAGCRELLRADYLVERYAPFMLLASGLLFALLAVLILQKHPGHAIGWLCSVIGLANAIHYYAWVHSECMALPLPATSLMAWISYLISPLSIIPLFVLMPMLFPDGQFLSRRWRMVAMVGSGLLVAAIFTIALLPGPMVYDGMGTTEAPNNPYGLAGLPAAIGPPLDTANSLLLLGLSLLGIFSLVARYRRSQLMVRQQLKWIAWYFAVVFGAQLLFFELPGAFISPIVFEGLPYLLIIAAVFLGYPIVIGIAILRYRLYDIDIIIRRTLVYTLVTGALALVYVGSIIVLQRLFVAVTGQQSTVAIVISTLWIAALFSPLRTRTQTLIDRRFYRRKYDAEATLARFGTVARDEVNLEVLTAELLNTVDRTVQPVGTSLWLRDRQA